MNVSLIHCATCDFSKHLFLLVNREREREIRYVKTQTQDITHSTGALKVERQAYLLSEFVGGERRARMVTGDGQTIVRTNRFGQLSLSIADTTPRI